MRLPVHPVALQSALLAAGLASGLAAQTYTPPVHVPGDEAIAPSPGNQANPQIARGAASALVVWQDDRSSLIDSVFGGQAAGSSVPGNFDIYGVLVDFNGRPLSTTPILINADSWDQINPRVAWNGVEYLVVFESTRPTAIYRSTGIYGTRVTAAGTVRDATPIKIYDDPDADERFPVLASAGGNWLVGWTNVFASSSLEGAVVSAAGVVGSKRVLVPAPAGSPPTGAQIASDGTRYLIAYSVAYSPLAEMRRLDAAGNTLGTAVTLTTTHGFVPAVGAHAGGFYVAWAGAGEVRGTPVDSNGVIAVPGGALLGTATANAVSGLGVAFDGQNWTFAYDQSPSVYAGKVAAGGTVLVAGRSIFNSARAVGQVTAANGAGRTPLFWSDHGLSNPYGADIADIFATSLDASGSAPAPSAVSVSRPSQIYPRMAGAPATGYLIVYVSTTSGSRRIVARHVDAWGRPSAAEPFLIRAGDHAIGFPDVACNGREFLVTWHEIQSNATNGPPPLIFFRRCLADGTLLDAAPVLVMEGGAPRTDAVGDVFLIGARYHHPTQQSTAVMRFRRIDGVGGGFLDSGPQAAQLGVSGMTDVVALADRWLLFWGNLNGAAVLADGSPQPVFYAADVAASTTRFAVAANEARDQAVIAYQYYSSLPHRTDVRMRRINGDGTSPDPLAGPIVSAANQAQLRPAIAALEGEYLAMWADHRNHLDYEPGIGDVIAARLDMAGSLLDPTGVPIHDDPTGEGAVVLERTSRGRALHVASDLDGGAYRLALGVYRGAGAQAWSDVGRGVPGLSGIPEIDGHGTLRANTPVDLRLAGMPASAAGALVLGTAAVNVPLFGGVFVPRPDVVLAVAGDARGAWSLPVQWPAGVPAQTSFYFQGWVIDAAAPQGLSASTGLRAVTP